MYFCEGERRGRRSLQPRDSEEKTWKNIPPVGEWRWGHSASAQTVNLHNTNPSEIWDVLHSSAVYYFKSGVLIPPVMHLPAPGICLFLILHYLLPPLMQINLYKTYCGKEMQKALEMDGICPSVYTVSCELLMTQRQNRCLKKKRNLVISFLILFYNWSLM